MKITAIVTLENKYLIPRLKDFFEKRFVLVNFFIIDSRWTLNGENRLVSILKSSYDFLILCDQSDLGTQWIPYITGFSQEKDNEMIRRINTIFYINRVDTTLPAWLKHFPVIRSFSGMNEHFEKVKNRWHRMDDVVAANKFLEIIGYEKLATPTLVGDRDKDLMLLELYIERGGDPNYVNDRGVPLINSIIRRDDVTLVNHLINRGCNINVLSRDRGTTPLMEAASSGRTELVELLIAMGADLNHASREGQTALILAIGNQHVATAMVLIREGADKHLKDNLGMTALKYASLYGFADLVELLEAEAHE